MGYLINIVISLALTAFELNFLPHFRIFGVIPLLVPFFIITLAYFRKGFEPFLVAAVGGIFFDLVSSYPFGVYLLFFMLIASLVRFFFHEGLKSLPLGHFLIMVASVTLLFYVGQGIYLFSQGVSVSLSSWIVIFWGLSVNAVYAILIYAFSSWYFEKLSNLEHKLKRR